MATSHFVHLVPSRELCGTSPEEFSDLLVRLAPLVLERRARLDERPGRKRAPGAGRPPRPLWLRLLVALTHLRQGTSVRATAAMFEMHERSVRRYRDEIEELLVEHGFQPPGASVPIRSLADLEAYIEELGDKEIMVDATEVRRSSPYPWEEQKKAFSGKTKAHVVKTTVLSDSSRRPLWVEANPSGEGRTFDVTMLRAQATLMAALAALAAAGVTVIADKGYRGLWQDLGEDAVLLPKRKPNHQPYTDEQKQFNKHVSQRRIPVEHAIGRMKWWRGLHYWRRSPAAFDRTSRAVGVLASIT